MTTLPNMGLTLPTQGAPGAGTWDDVLDANSALVDAHDHSPGKGTTVKTNGISINADLTFSSLYAPINLHRLTFASIVALSSNNKSLFVSDADNELYWRSNTGANVKLTSGSALNVAAFTGGIGGDYASVSALVDYDDATDTYRFRQEINTAVRQFAKVQFADIKLTEYDPAGDASVPANTVTIRSPDSLAGSYSLICPTALPGSTSLVQLDSAGQLTASNATIGGTPNFTGAVTMASTLNVTGVTTTGALAPASLSSTGLIFGQNGITSAVNTHITVSGTGEYKHGTQTLSISTFGFVSVNGTADYTSDRLSGSGTFLVRAGIALRVGDRIRAIRVFITDSATGPTTMQATLRSGAAGSAGSDVASSSASAGSGALQTLTIGSLTTTLAAGSRYWIQVNTVSGAATQLIWMAEVDYDRP